MTERTFQYLIVGSGAGGAALARELCRKGADVLVVERGPRDMTFGSTLVAAQYFDANPLTKMPRKTKEGVIIWRTFVAGGSTMVSCGNAMPSLVKELADYGIDLEEEIDSVMADMPISLTDESLLSSGTLRIKEAAVEHWLSDDGDAKVLRADFCKNCGNCTLGCAFGARWTAKELLEEACENGCEVKYGVKVRKWCLRVNKQWGNC